MPLQVALHLDSEDLSHKPPLRSSSPSLPLPPPDRHQRCPNLPNPPLRRQQIELRSRIPRILYLQPDAQAIQVFAYARREGYGRWAGADDEDVCRVK